MKKNYAIDWEEIEIELTEYYNILPDRFTTPTETELELIDALESVQDSGFFTRKMRFAVMQAIAAAYKCGRDRK